MAMFLVELPDTSVGQRFADAMVVSAEDADDAKAIAKSEFDGDQSAGWDAATVTALADKDLDDAASLVGWKLRVRILDSDPVIDLEVVGDATDDTIDELAALMVTALNATSIISGAAYTPNTLTIAEGSGTDDLGDKKVEVEMVPPNSGGVPIPGLVGTITDEGSATDDLTVVFPTDTTVVPQVFRTFRRGHN